MITDTCSYCYLKKLKKEAKKTNHKVTTIKGIIGSDIYVYPKSVQFENLFQVDQEVYRVAWLRKHSNSCTCHIDIVL